MKNPNLACDIFKILLTEHISSFPTEDDCFTNKPDRFLDKYAMDKLITSSFRISDQLLDSIDGDKEWQGIQKKNQEMAVKAQAQSRQPQPVKPATAEVKKAPPAIEKP